MGHEVSLSRGVTTGGFDLVGSSHKMLLLQALICYVLLIVYLVAEATVDPGAPRGNLKHVPRP